MWCKYFVQNINDTEYSNALASRSLCSESTAYTYTYLYMRASFDPIGFGEFQKWSNLGFSQKWLIYLQLQICCVCRLFFSEMDDF